MKVAPGLLVLASLLAAAGDSVAATVTLIVRPPADTPAEATPYVAGNHESLGPWAPSHRALRRADDGSWQTTLNLPDGYKLEYKISLGDWGTVEKSANGGDVANHAATISEGQVLEIDVAAWGKGQPAVTRQKLEPTLTGNMERIENFRSNILANNRDIFVYLPPGYDKEPDRRYPVLYMQDGQNMFDRATSAFGVEWEADETAEWLIRAGTIEPLIIVGITTAADRMNELSDCRSEKLKAGGKAALYGRFLVEELKPHIDKTFRTKPGRADTGIGGSSLGGYVSLYLAEQHPGVFGRVAAVSPAVLWNDGAMTKDWARRADKLPLKNTRIWIDVGSTELAEQSPSEEYIAAVRDMVAVLATSGLKAGTDYKYVVVEGAAHDEAAWRDRFADVLTFLFPAKR